MLDLYKSSIRLFLLPEARHTKILEWKLSWDQPMGNLFYTCSIKLGGRYANINPSILKVVVIHLFSAINVQKGTNANVLPYALRARP